MTQINIMFTRFSPFCTPLIVTMASGFLKDEGLDPAFSIATPDKSTPDALREGSVHVGQSAVSYPGALLVDLGVSAASGSFALGFTSEDLFLTAELSALEASGEGEVVSQPKVITGDKQQATIKSGTEVPYQEGSLSGQNTTSFKEAVLELDVTPNITPDDRIILDLTIT